MTSITTRAGKGSPLTNNEVDANFTNLNTDKAEKGANSDITSLSGITGGVSTVANIDFSTVASLARATGRLSWNSNDGCLEVGLEGSAVTMQVGQEILLKAYNSNSTIANGSIVYVNGTANGNPSIAKFIANGTIDPSLVLGIATEEILGTDTGYVSEFGLIRGLNTLGYSVGDILYASPTTPGAFTNNKPASPDIVVVVGVVIDVNATQGIVLTKIEPGVIASDVVYDNTASQLVSSNVKGAIDELDLKKADISLLSSNVTFYPTTAASSVSGYSKLVTSVADPDFNTTPVNVNTGILGQNALAPTLIASLASEANVLTGDIGGITVTTIGNIRRSTGNAGGFFSFEVYHRNSAGTETLIGTSPNTDRVSSEIYVQFFDSALIASQTFTSTDRIVLKFYGFADGNNTAFDFQFGGTEPVRALFPVQVSVIPSVTTASAITTETSTFNGILSAADTNVQAALSTLDDHGHGIADISGLQTELNSKLESGDLSVTTNAVGTAALSYSNKVFTFTPPDLSGYFTISSWTASEASTITSTDTGNWDTAYGWGDHGVEGYLKSNQTITLSGDVSGSGTTSIAVTVANDSHTHDTRYFTENEVNNFFDGTTTKTGYNKTNWDTSFGWGNHASIGYLTGNQTITLSGGASGSGTTSIVVTIANDSHTHDTRYFTETEINNFFSGSVAKTGYNKTNWDDAYGDKVNSAAFSSVTGVLTLTRQDAGTVTVNLDGRYLQSFTETDPIFTASPAAGIAAGDITNWNNAYGDKINSASFSGGVLTLTRQDAGTVTVNLDGRYLQSFTETDTLNSVTTRGATTTNAITVGSVSTANSSLQSQTSTLATVTPTAIATFSATTYGGGKFVITALSGGQRHISELLVTHNGTVAVATQYATITTAGQLATYEVDISGGNVRILATGASGTTTTYKVSKELLSA
jgi:hypothetical protein